MPKSLQSALFRLAMAALLCLALSGALRAQTPGYTINSFDGQYIYYNTNSGEVVREPIFPFFFVGPPSGLCQLGAIGINTLDNSDWYCNSAQTWVKFAGGTGGTGCVPSGSTPNGVLYDTGSGACDDADKLVWDPTNHRLLEGSSAGLNSNISGLEATVDGVFCGRIVADNHTCIGVAAQNNSGPAVGTASYAKSTGTNAGATGLDANAYEEPAMGQTVGAGFAGAGVYSSHSNIGAGTVTTSAAFRGFSLNQGTGVITNSMGFWAQANGNIGGGTVTNSYGLYGSAQSSGSKNYELYLEDQGSGANDYSIYSAGGKVQFAGPVRFGGTSSYYTFGGSPSGVRTITAPDTDTVIPVGISSSATLFLTGLNASTGVFTRAQPAYSDISGTPTLFYQTVQNAAGTPVTQEPVTKFTGTAVSSVLSAAGVTTVTLTAGAGGTGCTPPGSSGKVLYDDGMGGCSDVSQFSYSGSTLTGTGLTLDLSPATIVKQRLSAGLTTSTNGDLGYDTTAKAWHLWQNGHDYFSIASTNLGTAGQVGITNADGSQTYADPIVSYNYVNLLSAASATAQATGSATRVSTLSAYGTLYFTFASITGSPAGCTVQVKNYDSLGNSLANGAAISVSPANGTTSSTFTPASNLFTAAQMSATFACSGAYPSTGTVSVDYVPGFATFLGSPLPAGTNVIGHVVADTGSTTAVTGNVTVVQGTGTNLHVDVDTALPAGSNVIGHVIADSGSTTAVTGNVTVVQGTGTNLHVDVDTALPAGSNVIGHVIADSGSTTVVTGNVAVTVADAADVTLGAKADAKSTATDTTAITAMQVLKEISFMEQTPASRAVTNAGTFAVQASQSGNWTARIVGNGGGVLDASGQNATFPANWLGTGCEFTTSPTTITTGNGSPLSCDNANNLRVNLTTALPAGSNVIGHVIADSGSTTVVTGNVAVTVADSADVTLGAKADARSTSTDTTAITAMQVLKEISFMSQNPASVAVTNAGTFAVQASQSGNWTARIVGNGGGVLDASGQNATFPANWLATGCEFTTAPTTITTTKGSPLSCDSANNLLVNLATALPAGSNVIGHVIADSGSTTAVTGNVTVVQGTGSNLHMVCDSGCTPGGSFADSSAFTFNSSSINPVGFVVDDISTNAVAENSAGVSRMNSNRIPYFMATDGTGLPYGTTANPLNVSIWADKNLASSAPGQSPANSELIAGRYSNLISPIAPGQTAPLQIDRYGRLLVSIGSSIVQGVTPQDASGVRPVYDPCQSYSKSYDAKSITANTQILTGTAGRKFAFCSWNDQNSATALQNYAVVEGTGSTCATGVAAFPGMSGGTSAATGWSNVAPGGGRTFGNGSAAIATEATSGDNVCVYVTNATQVNLGYSYVLTP